MTTVWSGQWVYDVKIPGISNRITDDGDDESVDWITSNASGIAQLDWVFFLRIQRKLHRGVMNNIYVYGKAEKVFETKTQFQISRIDDDAINNNPHCVLIYK